MPLKTVAREFKEKYPDVNIILESYGSIDCARLLVDGNRTADLLAVADYNVITAYIFPLNLADWYIVFATNEMVIAFTNQSKYNNEINSTNWFEILTRTDVRFGHSDPNRDPAGYRTLLLWK
ncbi:MAG: substrate-binding domain-containing protein [Candidatus Odinarchaeota archaeon]|nr:substrate-binding domain-containing protein [Candidatus Odinarchaeota archaeon]